MLGRSKGRCRRSPPHAIPKRRTSFVLVPYAISWVGGGVCEGGVRIPERPRGGGGGPPQLSLGSVVVVVIIFREVFPARVK